LATRVSAVSNKSLVKVQVLTTCPGQFSFRMYKRTVTSTPRGSDEPLVTVTWKRLDTKYRTAGTSKARTVNLPKGTYRAVVHGKCGYRTTTTDSVLLKR
jgi:hypothetical protein